ncbi:MAG: urease accessory protein UreD [Propionibacteriaceae bacterium]
MTTRIAVELRAGRHRTTVSAGLLRAQVVHGPSDRVRIGLLATTALLLGGDEVDLEIDVGPGCTVELFDVAATVAYDGRGRGAAWRSRVVVAEDARLRWSGEPLVVSDGAQVLRTLEVDLATGAVALLRETMALGRHGEQGGTVLNRTRVRRAGDDVMVEDQHLVAGSRRRPGMLGRHRVIDTVTSFGLELPDAPGDSCRFALVEEGSSMVRYLGQELASSPLHELWREAILPTEIWTPSWDSHRT